MNRERKNKIVAIAKREVNKFVKEWKKDPYLWDTEADIHGELYVRIKKALNQYRKKGQYKEWMSKKERFHRVYCKPLTYINKGEKYYPDIVIYDDYALDADDKKINEPMLWVCEIKYRTEWGGDQSEENRKYDEHKLRNLLKQQDGPRRGTKRACCLEFIRGRHKKPFFKYKPIK